MNVCTITTRAGFGDACALADSVRLHHDNASVLVLALDDREHELDASGGSFELLRPDDLGLARFEMLAGIHLDRELREIIKPALLRLALARFQTVCYLEASTHVYTPLTELEDPAPAILVPRTRRPIPADGLRPNDADICRLGAYDSGCLALRRDRRVDEMLTAWTERLETAPAEEGPALRAHWLDLLPGRLPGTRVLEDPGVGVAAWNLHERRLEMRGRSPSLSDGKPLRLANFAGLGSESSEWHELATSRDARPLPAAFVNLFEQRTQLTRSLDVRPQHGYGYARLADGTPLNRRLRRAVARAEQLGRLHETPFSTAGTRALLDWLNEPAKDGGSANITRFWFDIYRERPDLQVVHPELNGRGGPGFLSWINAFGRDDYDVPTSLMPPGLRS